MPRHSKNNTASSVFTYAEKQKLNEYGTAKQRVGQDSHRSFNMCHLCLYPVTSPLTCEKGHIYCKSCIIDYLVSQKKEIKQKIAEYENNIEQSNIRESEENDIKKNKLLEEFESIGNLKNTKIFDLKPKSEEKLIIEDIKNTQKNMLNLDKGDIIKQSFWMPESQDRKEIIKHEKPSSEVLCPATKDHYIRFKKLYNAHLCSDNENIVCYSCKKQIKYQKTAMSKKCGHLFCKNCMDKICLKDGRCFFCSEKIKLEDLIFVLEGYTSFSNHNDVEAKKYNPSFMG